MHTYKNTMRACFTGYAVQAVVNNFAPLLFLTFQKTYGIPLEKITVLITVNFFLQLCVDFVSIFIVDKIGYRNCAVGAHIFAAAGLVSLVFLPGLTADPFVGILISVIIYAIGGGLLEVIISPIVEACPNDNKEKAMSLLHSFYCWGSVGVIAVSTLFFALFTTQNWKYLAVFWALIPAFNAFVFAKVPIGSLIPENEEKLSLPALLRTKGFILLFVIMFCAGACELSITQWASAYCEKTIGISKNLGDIMGPMLFAFVMGLTRLFFGKSEKKLNLKKIMLLSAVLCFISYILISLSGIPALSLLGFAVCGVSVAVLWPGTFSLASASISRGGTAMFAILALAGDLGCSAGPSFVGFISSGFSDNLSLGVIFASVFPILLTVCLFILNRKFRAEKN